MEVNHQIHSVCGMCSVRCPITVEERNNTIAMIYGNKQSPLKGALCARGVAGKALEEDAERPHGPLIRAGERGEGKWREVSWDEVFDYVARKVAASQEKYGKETSSGQTREGPFTRPVPLPYAPGWGSPNVCTHSPSCDLNTHHACKAVFGYGRGMMVYDYANCKHIVLQTRNIFEALNVGEARTVMRALRGGCKLSVIDIRHTVTASKADNVFVIRPGSDYAFNLAIINTLIAQGLYDKNYGGRPYYRF